MKLDKIIKSLYNKTAIAVMVDTIILEWFQATDIVRIFSLSFQHLLGADQKFLILIMIYSFGGFTGTIVICGGI